MYGFPETSQRLFKAFPSNSTPHADEDRLLKKSWSSAKTPHPDATARYDLPADRPADLAFSENQSHGCSSSAPFMCAGS
ncbi:hypothetical protein AVEN_106242-1 [Araneus ventricosus]|uniref:Uncharacterized protein n=1 Tax=Araneus ventricosus TaxID=182803 RepID=A0A4Y2HI19_ARAVE|nr:hypothetical protein AVEN_106242-1 [Araneus ventricosus]